MYQKIFMMVLTPTLVLVSVPLRRLLGYHEHVTHQWRNHYTELKGKVSVLGSVGTVVRVAIETSDGVMEAEPVPKVEPINYWLKKAAWPCFLQRWPTTERTRCIKEHKAVIQNHTFHLDQSSSSSLPGDF
ncbi:LOW QUALITY PROTEIN: protein mab-21-like 3 [Polymixia lowei]